MEEANIGWGGEFWLHNGVTLEELVEVVQFSLPDETREKVEKTHLKSSQKRREYMAGLLDGGEVDIEINYRAGSATDALIRTAKAAGDTRACRFVVPDTDGTPGWNVDTYCFVMGYPRGPVAAGELMKATVRVCITGAQTEAAAA